MLRSTSASNMGERQLLHALSWPNMVSVVLAVSRRDFRSVTFFSYLPTSTALISLAFGGLLPTYLPTGYLYAGEGARLYLPTYLPTGVFLLRAPLSHG